MLDPRGENTLAIAVTSDGGAGNGLEAVALTDLGTVRGGVPLWLDQSPGYEGPRVDSAALDASPGAPWSGALATITLPPDGAGTALRATIDWGDGTTSPGTLAGSGASRAVGASHTYASPGRYRVQVTVADAVSGSTLAASETVAHVGG